MTETFRALCAELLAALEEEASNWNLDPEGHPLVARARAALAAEAEGEELRFDGGYESGSMWTGHPLRPAALAAEPAPPAPVAMEARKMTDLSPAAQAVLDAYWKDEWGSKQGAIAAALRAAADQVVPAALEEEFHNRNQALPLRKMVEIRQKLNAIATELEAQP